ncbi:hypothetical protein TPENAI_20301 [Tenacibaculum litopenaei]
MKLVHQPKYSYFSITTNPSLMDKLIIIFFLLLFGSGYAQTSKSILSKEILEYIDEHYFYGSKYSPMITTHRVHPRKKLSKNPALETLYILELRDIEKHTSRKALALVEEKNWDSIQKRTKYRGKKEFHYNDKQEVAKIKAGVTKYLFRQTGTNTYECDYYERDKLYSKQTYEYFKGDLLKKFTSHYEDGKLLFSKTYIYDANDVLREIVQIDPKWDTHTYALKFTYTKNAVLVTKKEKNAATYKNYVRLTIDNNSYHITRYSLDKDRIESDIIFTLNKNNLMQERKEISRNYLAVKSASKKGIVDYGKTIDLQQLVILDNYYQLITQTQSSIDKEQYKDVVDIYLNRYDDLNLWIDSPKNRGATGGFIFLYKFRN